MKSREGCCADWPKPCSYHEGWQDALDDASVEGNEPDDETVCCCCTLSGLNELVLPCGHGYCYICEERCHDEDHDCIEAEAILRERRGRIQAKRP